MKTDNSTKLIIYNQSSLPLKVTSTNSDESDRDEFKVKKSAEINLKPGRNNLAFFYQSAELKLEANLNGPLNISLIHSQSNAEHLGKLVEINQQDEPIIITCNNSN